MELGAIHIDRKNGEVFDEAALDLLLDDVMEIAAERISIDEDAKLSAYVGNYEATDLRQEDESGAYAMYANLPPLVKRPIQWSGKYTFWIFCFFAPAMGIGSLILFLPEHVV